MTNRLIVLSTVLSLALSSGAWAQSTETETDTASEATDTAEQDETKPVTTADLELSLGEDASTPQIGETYIRESIQDWELQCIKGEVAEQEPCQMYQLLVDPNDSPVAEVSIFRLPEGGQAVAGATIIVPLETSLQAQLRISVDGGEGKRYPFAFCNTVGCFARVGLTPADIDQFKRGATAKITLVPFLAPDQTVSLDMSLKGFTASFDKVSVVVQ